MQLHFDILHNISIFSAENRSLGIQKSRHTRLHFWCIFLCRKYLDSEAVTEQQRTFKASRVPSLGGGYWQFMDWLEGVHSK